MIAITHSVAALLSALALSQTPPVNTQEEAPKGREDVICFAVAIHLVQAGDETVKQASQLLAMYYFGRAQAELPEAALMDELRTVAPRITGDKWEREKTRCGQGLAQAGEQLRLSAEAVDSQLAN